MTRQNLEIDSKENQSTAPLDSLGAFALFWAWAETMQPLNTHLAMTIWPGWLLPFATIALIFRPKSTWTLLVFLVLSTLRIFWIMPFTPNHVIFMLLINCSGIVAIAQQWIRERRWNLDRRSIYEALSPIAGWQLIVLYLFATVAKLNFDYFNPEVSCATALFDGFTKYFFLIPNVPFTQQVAIYLSVGMEFAIPICLIFQRTRRIGIVGAVLFHLLLAIHPDWGTSILTFTMVIYALLVLFADQELKTGVVQYCSWLINRLSPARFRSDSWAKTLAQGWVILVYLTTIGAVLATVYPRDVDQSFAKVRLLHTIVFMPHLAACTLLTVAVFVSYFRNPSKNSTAPSLQLGLRPANLCWLVLGLTLLNGCCPYLGLKTTTAFTMFSNLRTEGNLNNHFFMSRLPGFSYQDQLVLVVESNDPLLRPYVETGDWLTLFELRRISSRNYQQPPGRTYTLDHDAHHHMFVKPRQAAAPHFVRYRLLDQEYYAEKGIHGEHGLFEKPPWYQSRFLAFRPICSPGGPAPCDH